MQKEKLILIAIAALLAFRPAIAYEREHAAHLHGEANLMISLEKNDLDIMFESPSINIVGFEHTARSSAERLKVEKAKQKLEDFNVLFPTFALAMCELQKINIKSSVIIDNEHEHDDHQKTEDVHSEFYVDYKFHCDKPEKINLQEVKFINQFPGIEKLRLQAVINGKQKQYILTHDH